MNYSATFSPIFFINLNTPWEKVISSGVPVSFPAKTIISTQGSKGSKNGIYYIKRGVIKLSHITTNGDENILLYMGQGMLFNEIPMFQISHDYLFTCIEHAETVFWPKEKIDTEFVSKHPELMLNIIESLTKKAMSFYSQLCSLRSLSAHGNVCRALYSMYLFHQERGVIVPRLSQQELASFVGIHRCSLHKVLTNLKEEGLIGSYSRKKLVVLSPERLCAYAQDANRLD